MKKQNLLRHFPLSRTVAAIFMSCAVVSAFAQSSTSSSSTQPAGSGSGAQSGSMSDQSQSQVTDGNQATAATGRSELKRKDEKFIAKAATITSEDVRLSQVALTRATNPQVRSFAQALVSQHENINQELAQLATRKGVTLPTGKDASEDAQKWSEKQGANFDKDYVKRMIKSHKEAVSLFEDAASDSENPEIATYARKHLPALREHLRQAQELEKQVS